MNRLFLLVLCLLLPVLSVPALAVEDGADSGVDPVTIETSKSEEGVTVNVTITQPETADPVPVEEAPVSDPEAPTGLYSVTQPDTLENAPADDGDPTMVDVVKGVLGEYQRRTYTVQELDSSGAVVSTSTQFVPGLAGLDYEWIAGAVCFVVFLLGIFKLLGGLMRG